MLSIAYGVNIESESDKFFSASEDAMAAVDIAMLPGAFLVDVLPIRTNSSRRAIPKRSYSVNFHSQIRPGMVSWGQFQDVCKDGQEEH